MNSALLRLRESSERFSSTERGVAERILAEPQLVVDLSVHELAQRTFSSPSTIYATMGLVSGSFARPQSLSHERYIQPYRGYNV